MDENRFWTMIETAWQTVGGKLNVRQELAEGKLPKDRAEELLEFLEDVIPALRHELDCLSADDLIVFDRILERKLYEIDRADVHKYTDGSDDGFLYARGFIVALGKGYYEAVSTKPAIALMDLECEEVCYLSWHVYEEKFGKLPLSGISRESCRNKAAWPDLFK